MTKTLGSYSQTCLDAWINCENLLNGLGQRSATLSTHITNVLTECAHICMGTFHAIKNQSVNAAKLALLCIGICEECADICEDFEDYSFQQCAKACRNCSSTMEGFVPTQPESLF